MHCVQTRRTFCNKFSYFSEREFCPPEMLPATNKDTIKNFEINYRQNDEI